MSESSDRPLAAAGGDPVDEAAGAVVDLTLRGCLQRSATARERLAQQLYDRLHPAMAALGLLFVASMLRRRASSV